MRVHNVMIEYEPIYERTHNLIQVAITGRLSATPPCVYGLFLGTTRGGYDGEDGKSEE